MTDVRIPDHNHPTHYPCPYTCPAHATLYGGSPPPPPVSFETYEADLASVRDQLRDAREIILRLERNPITQLHELATRLSEVAASITDEAVRLDNPERVPHRDDHFAEYLRRARDEVMNDPAAGVGRDPGVFAGEVLDDLLDDYRLRADLGLGLLEEIPEIQP